MLSHTAEYALRAVVHLAMRGGEPCTVDAAARATAIPVGYLAKIMQQLSRAGLTSSQRGLHGGFVLIREPATLTLYEVVDAVDPSRRIRSCPLGALNHGEPLCALHAALDHTAGTVERMLRATTIGDLLASDRPALCRRPMTTAEGVAATRQDHHA